MAAKAVGRGWPPAVLPGHGAAADLPVHDRAGRAPAAPRWPAELVLEAVGRAAIDLRTGSSMRPLALVGLLAAAGLVPAAVRAGLGLAGHAAPTMPAAGNLAVGRRHAGRPGHVSGLAALTRYRARMARPLQRDETDTPAAWQPRHLNGWAPTGSVPGHRQCPATREPTPTAGEPPAAESVI